MTHNIAVVGAGPGGLASAMLLAARGLSVDVYEKQATVGGRTRTFPFRILSRGDQVDFSDVIKLFKLVK